MYSFNTRVRYSEVDSEMNMTIPAILTAFQDCSVFHSYAMDDGPDRQRREHYAWMLSSWHIRIERLPKCGEELLVGTWPTNQKGFFAFRNFIIKDAAGNTCAVANSIWLFVNTEKGGATRMPPEIIEKYYGKENDPPIPDLSAARKLKLSAGCIEREPIEVHVSDIDSNNHVNNVSYVRMAMDFLPEGFDVRELKVEYKRETRLGDVLYPKTCLADGALSVGLCSEEGLPHAIVEFY